LSRKLQGDFFDSHTVYPVYSMTIVIIVLGHT